MKPLQTPFPATAHLLAHQPADRDAMIRLYERLAPKYDRLHRRWLYHAGGEAQAALEAAVRMALSLTPQARWLDAGCGTGRLARALAAEGVKPDQITLLDPSKAMLHACKDIPASRRAGRLEALPFADASFDVITCAWALETVPQPDLALSELCRVLRPGGALCLIFCANVPTRNLRDWLLRKSVMSRGTGQFLHPAEVTASLKNSMPCDVQAVPCAGPVATLLARRIGAPS